MIQPELIVMAAGLGSRYGGLKQIDPIGPHGEIILDYSIYDAISAGFESFIFVVSEKIALDFEYRITKSIASQYKTHYIVQEIDNLPSGFNFPVHRTKPWGTAHAVWSCKDVVQNHFAVINADDFYGRTAFSAICDYLTSRNNTIDSLNSCMVGYQLENTLTEHGSVSRGICDVDSNGYLLSVHERTHIGRFGDLIRYKNEMDDWIPISRDSVTSMNMWGFPPKLFNKMEELLCKFLEKNHSNLHEAEFFIPDVVNDLLETNSVSVKVLETKDQWFGITYKSDKSRVESAVSQLVQQGVYPEKLWEN